MLEIEPSLEKVRGYAHLVELRNSMATATTNKQSKYVKTASAS